MNKYRDVRYIFHISICLCFVLFLNLVSINGYEVNGTSSRENPSTSTPAVRQPDGTSRVGPEQQTPQRVQPKEEEEKDFNLLLEREPPGAAESDEQTFQDDVVGEAAEDLTDNGDENSDENDGVSEGIDAPVAIYGNNIYVTWWTNETGNDEVMFRASTDSGQSFRDQINLSNTIDADSTRVEIDSDADSVVVTWWETNQTSDTPFMKVSNGNGETFGPLLELATSGTIGAAEE